MIILGIETSCDETALSIIEAVTVKTGTDNPHFKVLGNALISQIKIHEQYGGVFPMVAKREHAKNLSPLLRKVLGEAGMLSEAKKTEKNANETEETITDEILEKIKNILAKEAELSEHFIKLITEISRPAIDTIAVTSGPGLEPALWVGISFAKALSLAWNIPVVAVNHMEGHIIGSLLEKESIKSKESEAKELPLKKIAFPALSLLISGGHTELVLVKNWRDYQLIGKTRDDAIGEAFDKVARLLGLPYPGGPELSRLAETRRSTHPEEKTPFPLPRPMLHSDNFEFSFSGIKTAVLYLLKGQNEGHPKEGRKATEYENSEKTPLAITEEIKQQIAREFEDAVTETLIVKTAKALEEHGVQTLIIGGGVIANIHIRKAFEELSQKRTLTLYLPDSHLATDNALMIAIAGYFVHTTGSSETFDKIRAEGNLSF